MALAETARLLASIELQDKFSGTIRTVEGKLDRVGTKLDVIGTKAKTKFGALRDAAKDSNTQTSAVNALLVGIERFVPPSIRPLVDGLEALNNQSPKGLLALVATGIQSGKAITVNLVEKFAEAGGLPGVFTALGGVSVIAAALAPVAALLITQFLSDLFNNNPARSESGVQGKLQPVFNPFDFQGLFNNLQTLGEVAGKAVDQILHPKPSAAQPTHQFAGTAPGFEPGGDFFAGLLALGGIGGTNRPITMKWRPSDEMQVEDRRGYTLQQEMLSSILTLKQPPPVVNITTRVQVLGQTVTTTYNRYVASIPGLLP